MKARRVDDVPPDSAGKSPWPYLVPPYHWSRHRTSEGRTRFQVVEFEYGWQLLLVLAFWPSGWVTAELFAGFQLPIWFAALAGFAASLCYVMGGRVELEIEGKSLTVREKWWCVPYSTRELGDDWSIGAYEDIFDFPGDWWVEIQRKDSDEPVIGFGTTRCCAAVVRAVRRAAGRAPKRLRPRHHDSTAESPVGWLLPPFQWSLRTRLDGSYRFDAVEFARSHLVLLAVAGTVLCLTSGLVPAAIAAAFRHLFGVASSFWSTTGLTLVFVWWVFSGLRVTLIVDGRELTVRKRWWFVPYAETKLGEDWRIAVVECIFEPGSNERWIEVRRTESSFDTVVEFGAEEFAKGFVSAVRHASRPENGDPAPAIDPPEFE